MAKNNEEELDLTQAPAKFKAGELVKCPLVDNMLVLASFNAVIDQKTGKQQPLDSWIYELMYKDNDGVVRMLKLAEAMLEACE